MKITMSFNHLTSLIVGMALLNFGYVHTDVDELTSCPMGSRTIVYVVNNTDDDLNARIDWTLQVCRYMEAHYETCPCPARNTNVAIPSKSKVAITKFKRGLVGLDRVTFMQELSLPGVDGSITLKQYRDRNKISYSLSGPNIPKKIYTDRSSHVLKFTKSGGGYYTISFYSKYTGGYDDIVYEIDYHK